MKRKKVAVIGAGMFGYPMANYVGSNGHEVRLYDADESVLETLNSTRKHPVHFIEKEMNENVKVSSDLEKTVKGSDIVILAVPSQRLRGVAAEIKYYIGGCFILNLAKGLELSSNKRLSEVITEEFEKGGRRYKLSTLSGGMIASEFAEGKPLFATIASDTYRTAQLMQKFLTSRTFYPVASDDFIGVEYAGPLKNVIAINVGIGIGVGYKASTIGGFIAAFSEEAEELAVKLGAKRETFSMKSQAWAGDLIATCFGNSRNRSFGIEIGKGATVEEALERMKSENKLVEGYPTTKVFYELATGLVNSGKIKEVPPIITEAYKVLYESKHAKKAINDLMEIGTNGR